MAMAELGERSMRQSYANCLTEAVNPTWEKMSRTMKRGLPSAAVPGWSDEILRGCARVSSIVSYTDIVRVDYNRWRQCNRRL